MSPKVLDVTPMEQSRLKIRFDTGEIKVFDVTPYILGERYGKLADPAYFATVRPAGRTVEWADGQDIAPHELYELSVS